MKLIVIKGLPGSGKSTWVREEIKKPGVVRVESDLLRRMLHGEQWIEEYEPAVNQLRVDCVISLLKRSSSDIHTVIDDECSQESEISRFRKIATIFDAEFEIKSFLDVPIEECIRRDSLRPEEKRVGASVIMKIAERYEQNDIPSRF